MRVLRDKKDPVRPFQGIRKSLVMLYSLSGFIGKIGSSTGRGFLDGR